MPMQRLSCRPPRDTFRSTSAPNGRYFLRNVAVAAVVAMVMLRCGRTSSAPPRATEPHAHPTTETHAHPPPPSAAGNVVQVEMRALLAAMESTVRGLALGDVREVPHALHRVHAAREATEAALADGGYRPPQGADQLDAFRQRDEAFHGVLERLVSASGRNDLAATADAFGEAMHACQPCHAVFRRSP